MGILAPIFLAGLAALSIPLILHLVRRTPRGRQTFSSLMFLTPSPPRLTRRSRLEQILLLLMRLAALGLLALAFSRPFLREAALLSTNDLARRRVAIVIDTSASMRRADLWQQAIAAAQRELDELTQQDDVALFTFADRLTTVVDFDTAREQTGATRSQVVAGELKKLRPTWTTGDLGTALTTVATELAAERDTEEQSGEPQVVLISDFQKGSRIDALTAYEWPKDVRLIARQLKPKQVSNAHLQLLPSDEDVADPQPRVRVANAADSTVDQFFVRWASATPPLQTKGTRSRPIAGTSEGNESAVYVPPGQSRIVRLPRPQGAASADRIALRGDDHDFDNSYYVVPLRKQEVKLLYLGPDAADDPQGMQYYLRLAVAVDPLRQVAVDAQTSEATKALADPLPPQVIIVTRAVAQQTAGELVKYAERGGLVVFAPHDGEAVKCLPLLFEGLALGEDKPTSEDDFSLLGEIDFGHPLFAPLAGPRYSDFTKIHFWRHWAVQVSDGSPTRAVARFDTGEPAILERPIGKGRIVDLESSWRPDDSQLALSSKFVPLVMGLLDLACGKQTSSAAYVVGGAVPLREGRSTMTVRKPDGSDVTVQAAATSFTDTSEPGIYEARGAADDLRLAVNLAAAESNTAPLALEQLEQLGVQMGPDLSRAQRLAKIRQQRDTELEARQKVWQWLLVGVLGLLVVETWWAGRAARQSESQKSEAA